MSHLAREFAKAGVRHRHPEFTDDEVAQELARLFYGRYLPSGTPITKIHVDPW